MFAFQSAGNAVKRATEALVTSAQQAKVSNEEEEHVHLANRPVGAIAQLLQAQEEIIRKEKELQEARRKLGIIHQRQNKFIQKDTGEDSSSSF